MSNRTVTVRYVLDASRYQSGPITAENQKIADSAKRAAQQASVSMQAQGTALRQVGRGTTIAGAVIEAAFVGMGKAAVDWQSDFTGVTKTVNDNAAGYRVLENDLRGLARTMPETHKQIAATAEAAGQLGVSRAALVPFVKTMTELGDTTNLSADEAATSIAQLMSVMGTAPGQVTNLGAALVDLGNNGASTERDIVQMAQRISGMGNTVGLTEQEVLGLASAISSTGINVEAGGTAISRTLDKVDQSVRKGGAGLDALAETSGMTADQFTQAWGQDAGRALLSFVEGLGKMQSEGKDTSSVLKALGSNGIYERDVLLRLAGATKVAGAQQNLLRENLDRANSAWDKNTALTAEAQKRYETDASKIQIAINNIRDSAIQFGGAFLPIIADGAESVADFAHSFQQLDPGLQGFIVKGGAIAGIALLAGGGLLTVAGNALQLAANLKTANAVIPGLNTNLASLARTGLLIGAVYAGLEVGASVLDHFAAKGPELSEVSVSLQKIAAGSGDLNSLYSGPNWADTIMGTLTGTAEQADDLSGALVKLNDAGNDKGFIGWLYGVDKLREKITPGTQGLEKMAQQVGVVDRGLAELVTSGHADQAAKAFAKISDDSGIAPAQLVDRFAAYRDELRKLAEQAGVTELSQQDLADWMGGKVPAAVQKAASGNAVLKSALDATNDSTKTAAQNLADLITQTFAYANAQLALSGGAIAAEAAIDAATKAAKENGKTLDITTAKGRANQTALDAITASSAQYTSELIKQQAPADKIVSSSERYRAAWVKSAVAMGMGRQAAIDMSKALFQIPPEIRSQVVLAGGKISKAEAKELNHELRSIPKEQRAKIVTIAETKGAKAARQAMAEVKDKTVIARSKGDLKGAKEVDAAMKALRDRLVLAKSRGDTRGAKAIEAAMKALRDKTVTAHTKGDLSGVNAVRSGMAGLSNKTVVITTIEKGIRLKVPKNATGGRLDGPGTETSDDILLWGSRNEWVIKAASSRYYGDGIMGAINRGDIPREAFTPYGFADGGRPGMTNVNGIQRFASGGKIEDLLYRLVRAPFDPLAAIGAAERAVNAATKRLAAENAKVRGPRAALDRATRANESAKDRQEDLRDRVNQLRKRADATKGVTKADRDLKRAQDQLRDANVRVTKTNRDKSQALAAYNKVAGPAKEATQALRDAQKELADQQKAAADNARNLSDQFSDAYRSESTDARDWLDLMKQGSVDIGTFQAKITKLRQLGLNETLVQQILGRGAQEGTAVADSILSAGKSLVDGLNKANQGLQDASDKLGVIGTDRKRRYAGGGQVIGFGGPTDDQTIIAASPREWVQPVASVDYYGEGFMNAVQHRLIPKQFISGHYAYGGQVGRQVATTGDLTPQVLAALSRISIQVQTPFGPDYYQAQFRVTARSVVSESFSAATGAR